MLPYLRRIAQMSKLLLVDNVSYDGIGLCEFEVSMNEIGQVDEI